MITCDQFIYTTAKTTNRAGYQVVAKSAGVQDDIIDVMTGYLYPTGLNLDEYEESRALRVLNNELIAYSIIKNIGIGYDTRKNTLYNHTFLITKTNFANIDNDTRHLEPFFNMDYEIRGNLPIIKIKPTLLPIDFRKIQILSDSQLKNTLRFLISGKKTAILDFFEMNIIPNILAILPSAMRLVAFSTLVPQPSKQPDYEFIQTKKNMTFQLGREWMTVQDNNDKKYSKTNSMTDFEYLSNLILKNDQKTINSIHKRFNDLIGKDNKNKLKFVLNERLN